MIDNSISKNKFNDCLEFTNSCLNFYHNSKIDIDFYEVANEKNIDKLVEFEQYKTDIQNANIIVCIKNKGVNIGFIKDGKIYLLNNGNIINSDIEPIKKYFDSVNYYKI